MEKVLNDIIDSMAENIINSTIETVRIKSVLEESNDKTKPFGEGIDKALNYTLDLGKRLEMKSENIDGYAGFVEIGHGKDMVGVLAHIDVVPEGNGWMYPPYEGMIEDRKLYGRGALDDKGPLIACMYALKAIEKSKIPISKRCRLIIGTDEETFGRGIKYYLKKSEKPKCGFSPDAEFPVIYAEKGILRFEIQGAFNDKKNDRKELKLLKVSGGTKANVVPDYAKARVKIKGSGDKNISNAVNSLEYTKRKLVTINKEDDFVIIEVKGQSAHASTPKLGVNAVSIIIEILSKLDIASIKFKKYIDVLRALTEDVNGKKAGFYCNDEISGDLTLNIGVIEIDDVKGRAVFDIRYPVMAQKDEIWQKICGLCNDDSIKLLEIQDKKPLYVDPKSKLIKILQKVYKEMMDQNPELIAIGGGTYCRYLDNFVAFGPVFPGQRELAHEPDEYISLSDLILVSKIYAQAIYELIK